MCIAIRRDDMRWLESGICTRVNLLFLISTNIQMHLEMQVEVNAITVIHEI